MDGEEEDEDEGEMISTDSYILGETVPQKEHFIFKPQTPCYTLSYK